MSLSIEPLKTLQVVQPTTAITGERTFAILKGPSQVSFKPSISTSYSNSQINFSAPPPNPGIIVDRCVGIKYYSRLTFAGTSTSGNLLQIGLNDAPRAFPISSTLQTLQVTLNNTSVSINMADVVHPLMRYWTSRDVKETAYSMSPSMLDQFQSYSDWVTLGSGRNPMALYGENLYQVPRGGFSGMTVVSNTPTSAVVDLEITEPLFLSPFLFGSSQEPGFIGLQTMDFNFTLGDLAGMWSHSSAGNSITSIAHSFNQAPQLLFRYMTPDMTVPIPKSVVYPYFEVQRYPTTYGALAAGSSTTISSSSIQLNSIPRRLYIFARDTNTSGTSASWLTSNAFAAINSVNVNWNNQSGLLSSATQQDLYRLSALNGCNMSWTEWSKQVGGVLALEFGQDIGLQPTEAPGLMGTYQLQINMAITNPSAVSKNYTMYIVAVSEGTFTIAENRAVSQIGVITPSDILNSKSSPFVSYDHVKMLYGGSFWSGFRNFLSDAYSTVKSVLPIAKQVASVAKGIPVIGAYAAPVSAALDTASSVIGAGARRKKGGARTGPLSKAELLSLMSH